MDDFDKRHAEECERRDKCMALCEIINSKQFCHAELDYEFDGGVYGVYMTYDGGRRRVRLDYRIWHNDYYGNVHGWLFGDEYRDRSADISVEGMTLEEIANAMENTAKEMNARSENEIKQKEVAA